ncbi:MAG: tetratricopeptide repeat protein, partial [Acidimicrobiales bacterium]
MPAFQRAIELDPGYTQASLWLAQTRLWAGAPLDLWRDYAARAAAGPGPLSPRERMLAQALLLLGSRRYPDACAAYRRLVDRDTTDVDAWFGLAECQARDRVVEADAASPSRWSFRSSYQGAIQAYGRALVIVPAAHQVFAGRAFDRLARLFFVESNVYRAGYGTGPDTARFAAWPVLDSDTIAFVPFPFADVMAGRQPPAYTAAVARSREQLRTLTGRWVAAFPRSADAQEASARALEALGELGDGEAGPPGALGAVRRARGLAKEPTQLLRLAMTETRLLVKLERFAAARTLADSVLDAWPRPTPAAAGALAGLAALTGQVQRTVIL